LLEAPVGELRKWDRYNQCLLIGQYDARKIFGSKRDEVTDWRRQDLHRKKLYALHFSPNIIRVINSRKVRWAEHVARMGERRGAYRVLVEKPEGKIQLGRPRRKLECNIKIGLKEVGMGPLV